MPETDAVRDVRSLKRELLLLEESAMKHSINSRIRSWYQGQAYGQANAACRYGKIDLDTHSLLLTITNSWMTDLPRSLKEIWP